MQFNEHHCDLCFANAREIEVFEVVVRNPYSSQQTFVRYRLNHRPSMPDRHKHAVLECSSNRDILSFDVCARCMTDGPIFTAISTDNPSDPQR